MSAPAPKASVCVVGLGYIGLPTAALLAMSGFDVLGVDIDEGVVDALNRGRLHFEEPELDILVRGAVASGRFRAAPKPEPAGVFIVAVPTPITADRQPDLSHVFAVAQSIATTLHGGDLVIVESTCPVGTTERFRDAVAALRPDLATESGLAVDIAHCPERVLPGRILRELVENDRVVGGLDESATRRAADFYRTFVKGRIFATDARTAELTKLTENSFRDVNIAFANELSIICEAVGVDVWEVIRLANRHPRVNILKPGPGVGGHCIAVDPWFLVSAAPERAPLISTARAVNDGKRDFVAAQIKAAVGGDRRARVACLGLAFKADVGDLRESPALEIVEMLQRHRAGELIVCDPVVGALPATLKGRPGLTWEDVPARAVAAADIVALLVDHSVFRAIDRALLAGKRIVDTRGAWLDVND